MAASIHFREDVAPTAATRCVVLSLPGICVSHNKRARGVVYTSRHVHIVFLLTPYSLAQPTRYVGRKPHRYTFSSATNNIHNVDVSPDQVKVYLNSGGHAKGNGTGPGVTYNKV